MHSLVVSKSHYGKLMKVTEEKDAHISSAFESAMHSAVVNGIL